MICCNVLKTRGRGGPVDVERKGKTRRGGSDCYTSFEMGVLTSWKQLKGKRREKKIHAFLSRSTFSTRRFSPSSKTENSLESFPLVSLILSILSCHRSEHPPASSPYSQTRSIRILVSTISNHCILSSSYSSSLPSLKPGNTSTPASFLLFSFASLLNPSPSPFHLSLSNP